MWFTCLVLYTFGSIYFFVTIDEVENDRRTRTECIVASLLWFVLMWFIVGDYINEIKYTDQSGK